VLRFYKYHGLGNDYIILEQEAVSADELSPSYIRLICHRNFGVGSDGILYGPLKSSEADFAIRIFNPDGSEAEKSGNGLRIFSRFLWDKGLVKEDAFTVETIGGIVRSQILNNGELVTVDMGTVSFDSRVIPVEGPQREVLKETILIDGQDIEFCAATIGNPHCVIQRDHISADEAMAIGPLLETDSLFPNKTNVQFMKVLDRSNIAIEIWERGAGYTLASGSSACASAAVARKMGLCDGNIAVRMPGGTIQTVVTDKFQVTMTGPVVFIAEGRLAPEMLEQTI
jgi:diaminopimelate epimerase